MPRLRGARIQIPTHAMVRRGMCTSIAALHFHSL
jgi:hypothetical protein